MIQKASLIRFSQAHECRGRKGFANWRNIQAEHSAAANESERLPVEKLVWKFVADCDSLRFYASLIRLNS